MQKLTFRFRVKDKQSRKRLSAWAAAVNAVWNHCNAMQQHARKHNQQWPTAASFQASTKGAYNQLNIPAQTVQAVCEEYFSKRTQFRKAKLRWRGNRSLGWVPFKNQTIRLDAKSGAIRYNRHQIRLWLHREIRGRIICGSFNCDSLGRWYCNLVVECAIEPMNRTDEVGIDLGLRATATLSNGRKIENTRVYARYEASLAKAQRANKKRLAKAINAKIANVRRDFLHKATTEIADRFRFISIGDVSGMWLQSTNGKSSTDAATGMFRRLLRYKAISRGVVFIDVSERLSTQTCSDCTTVGGPKGIAGLEIREWRCSACGSVHDRDVNAARNILRLGHQALAEGSPERSHNRRSRKDATRSIGPSRGATAESRIN